MTRVRHSNAGNVSYLFKNFRSEKRFLKEIEVISIKDILSCEEFPVVLMRSYEIDSYIMGYHVYKTNWTPVVGSDRSIVGNLPLEKSGKFAETIFYFLKANKKHSCVIKVCGKAINGGGGLGMKVPCRLLFFAEEKYINVLKEKLCTLL